MSFAIRSYCGILIPAVFCLAAFQAPARNPTKRISRFACDANGALAPALVQCRQ